MRRWKTTRGATHVSLPYAAAAAAAATTVFR